MTYEVYEKGGIDTDRLEKFLDKHITTKFKKKLIIMDNASSHRNERIKELVEKDNKLLYSIPYQHYCNAIENYFSILKAKLKKLDNLSFKEIDDNIKKVIIEIPKEHYYNIFKGNYVRDKETTEKNKKKKLKIPKKKYKPNTT